MDYVIDILVILLVAYIARLFWIISNRRTGHHSKLLFRAISIFVLIHLILFPLFYAIIINSNPQSISINENIVTDEKEEKLKHHLKIDEKIQHKIEKEVIYDSNFINQLLDSNKIYFSKLEWKEIDDSQLIFLDSIIIRANTEPRVIPEDRIRKSITFYDTSGKKIVEMKTSSREEIFSDILTDLVTELTQDLEKLQVEKTKNQEQIVAIQANAFWSYRQILPYTLNILFTSNFNPQSRIANVIYFIHNIFVVFFLLAFIVNISQYQFFRKDKNNS